MNFRGPREKFVITRVRYIEGKAVANAVIQLSHAWYNAMKPRNG